MTTKKLFFETLDKMLEKSKPRSAERKNLLTLRQLAEPVLEKVPHCVFCHGTGNCQECSGKGICPNCDGTGEDGE
jgi:hypothetical protein